MHHYAWFVMTRITFSLPKSTAILAASKSTSQRRSLSSYITLLVEADLRSDGSLATDHRAEAIAVIDELGADRALVILRGRGRGKAKLARAN